MNKSVKRKLYKIVTVLGAIVFLLPNGLPMYWGNLSVYVNSYFVVCLDSTSGNDDPWISSVFLVFWTASLLLYNSVRERLGKRWTAALGCLCTDVGFFASYVSVQTSFALFNVTLAVLGGIGTGLLEPYCLRLLLDWADGDTGFLVTLTQGAFYWGGAIINGIVTLYINPDNMVPDTRVGKSVYFTRRKILDEVPAVFLAAGCFAIMSHVIGYLLMRENTFDGRATATSSSNNGETPAQDNPEGTYSSFENNSQEQVNAVSRCTGTCTDIEATKNDEGIRHLVSKDAGPVVTKYQEDRSPREVLKCVSFYLMWVIYLFATYPCLLITNYYKSFGQLYIHDDYFLTYIGTVTSFFAIFTKILSGLATDKLGVRRCMIFEITFIALTSAWCYFTAVVHEWLYFVAIVWFSSLASALFSSIPVTTVSMFGKTHFSANFGLLRASALILGVSCPFFIEPILRYLGWFYIFASVTFVHLISLILILYCVSPF